MKVILQKAKFNIEYLADLLHRANLGLYWVKLCKRGGMDGVWTDLNGTDGSLWSHLRFSTQFATTRFPQFGNSGLGHLVWKKSNKTSYLKYIFELSMSCQTTSVLTPIEIQLQMHLSLNLSPSLIVSNARYVQI